MISVSNEYKQAMAKSFRDRAYVSVGIGVINQNAQSNGTVKADLSYWSSGNIFNSNKQSIEYATMENDYFRADGSMYFMPQQSANMQLLTNGVTTNDFLQPIRIDFNGIYAIKGITLDFGGAFPTEFTIETNEKTLSYTNDSAKFVTNDVLGDTTYIIITPIAMVGGEQRFRIKNILMGVGLAYSNYQTKDLSITETVSSISEELPSADMEFSFYDEDNNFNVDDDNSFIDFLETMQKVTVSFGVTLEDKSVEWYQIATLHLKDWSSKKGIVSITATDRLAQMEDEYTLANTMYERTAYEEAVNIFTDAGLQPDEYYIDDYLNDVPLVNPMPIGTHKECLQILANACRCIIRQDEKGIIRIVANFANILDPYDFDIETNGVAEWSKPENLFVGSDITYAELNQDFMKADGNMYFLPNDKNYLETSYVSEQIADDNGNFETNPTITISLPAAYTYFGINVNFNGNPPEEMIVHTYNSNKLVESKKYTYLVSSNYLYEEFKNFDKIVFEFTKGYPNNRVLVNKISFGDLSDYVLEKHDMTSQPLGYKEKRVKAVRCKVFTYEMDGDKPQEIEDEVYVAKALNLVGEIKTIQNPLVSTQEHAQLIAEWVGNYYLNNVSYDVEYRGDPRLNAADIIHMESDVLDNLQVEIASHNFRYNGAFKGSLELRRAFRKMGG